MTTAAEFNQLQRPRAGAADAVVEAHPLGCIALPDLMEPHQLADP